MKNLIRKIKIIIILFGLYNVWRKAPYLRLCQMFENTRRNCGDMFYIENEKFIKLVKNEHNI